MANVAVSASQLFDQSGALLNGWVTFHPAGSGGEEPAAPLLDLAVVNGAVSGSPTIATGTYDIVLSASSGIGTEVALLSNVSITASFAIDTYVNSKRHAQIGSAWQWLTGNFDLIVSTGGANLTLPPIQKQGQIAFVVNAGTTAITVSSSAAIGNGASPPTSVTMPAAYAAIIAGDLKNNAWRIVSVYHSTQ